MQHCPSFVVVVAVVAADVVVVPAVVDVFVALTLARF
jgi:hypothetical protein